MKKSELVHAGHRLVKNNQASDAVVFLRGHDFFAGLLESVSAGRSAAQDSAIIMDSRMSEFKGKLTFVRRAVQ